MIARPWRRMLQPRVIRTQHTYRRPHESIVTSLTLRLQQRKYSTHVSIPNASRINRKYQNHLPAKNAMTYYHPDTPAEIKNAKVRTIYKSQTLVNVKSGK